MESEFEFTLNGRTHHASRERVIEALRDVDPEPSTRHMVTVEGGTYPVVQAFAETFGLDRRRFTTPKARSIFSRLGFEVTSGHKMEPRPRPAPPRKLPRPIFHASKLPQDLVQEVIELPPIILNWSYFWDWDEIANGTDDDEDIDLPPSEPGVYRVIGGREVETLCIGRAANLRQRICSALIAGKAPHTAGCKIRENEDLSTVRIAWAVTNRPAAAEEELHRRHVERNGHWPKYTQRT
ncbi:MAG: hypothetical protein FJX75_02780 [Armatimonadetes bacterium]|nr:hypothetical protein [Armatimonadota bacterium]